MRAKQIMIISIVLVLIVSLASCSSASNPWTEQMPNQPGQNSNQNSLQNGVQSAPPISVKFDSMSEIKVFFDSSLAQSKGEVGEKTVDAYHAQSEAVVISEKADNLLLPLSNDSVEVEAFSARWSTEKQILDIIYRIDDVQYRFRYYFNSSTEWVCEKPAVQNVQVGPYKVDFEQGSDEIYENFYFAGIQTNGVYISIWVRGNGGIIPSFNMFNFEALSSVE